MNRISNIFRFFKRHKLLFVLVFSIIISTNAQAACTAQSVEQSWADFGNTIVNRGDGSKGRAYLPIKTDSNNSTYLVCNDGCKNHIVIVARSVVQVGWPNLCPADSLRSILKSQGSATYTQLNNWYGFITPVYQTQEHFECRKNGGQFEWVWYPSVSGGHAVSNSSRSVSIFKRASIYTYPGPETVKTYCDYVIISDPTVLTNYDYQRKPQGQCDPAGIFAGEESVEAAQSTASESGNSAGADNVVDSGATSATAEEQSDNDEPDNVDDVADDADPSTGAGGTNTSTTNCNTQQEKDERGASEIKMSGNLCIAETCKQNYYMVKNNNVY